VTPFRCASKPRAESPETSFPTFRETSKDMLPEMMLDTKSSSHFGEGKHRRSECPEIIISCISVSILTWISDASLILVPFITSGAKVPCRYSKGTSIVQIHTTEDISIAGVRVHSGFLLS